MLRGIRERLSDQNRCSRLFLGFTMPAMTSFCHLAKHADKFENKTSETTVKSKSDSLLKARPYAGYGASEYPILPLPIMVIVLGWSFSCATSHPRTISYIPGASRKANGIPSESHKRTRPCCS